MAESNASNDVEFSRRVRWLEGKPKHIAGTTFGLPWTAGKCDPQRTTFVCVAESGVILPLQTWITAFWQDGSIKWTGHAIPATSLAEDLYTVFAKVVNKPEIAESQVSPDTPVLKVTGGSDKGFIRVQTGKIEVCFSTVGSCIIQSITTLSGKTTGENGRLILLSQSSISEDSNPRYDTKYFEFEGRVGEAVIEQSGPIRAVIAIRGHHHVIEAGDGVSHTPWLPFIVRFYLYANSESFRMMHTIVYDGDMNTDFIRGLGIRFDVPLGSDALTDRHVRIAGVDGGVFSEAVKGVTGLRRDPGTAVREAQLLGKPAPPLENWDADVTSRLHWVPSWIDFTLSQSSPDGFNLQKRTKAGCSWVKIPSGTRAGGLAYLGGASGGGLVVALKDFWERYPTGIDIRNAASEIGEITLWLYTPSTTPMDLRQYHDGLGQNTFDDQLDALNITYEDWEPGTGTPYGIARTNELQIFSFEQSPNAKTIADLTESTRKPPVLSPNLNDIHHTGVFGSYWCPSVIKSSNLDANLIHSNLNFLFEFHKSQVSERKWYGFWDYGDIMHAYDGDRHTWCYDIGGYAWDNSELSPDLWLWLYFLQTGRSDVYRMAEALTRHTGEVDVYHIGPHKGLGTRHGVQHWSDSCKQARISNALYRKYFYFISGGDERIGELLQENLETEKSFLFLDPYRKVRKDNGNYVPDPKAISMSLGTDWAAIASAWIIEVERRGPKWKDAESRLLATVKGIGMLANGFVTGTALYDTKTGELSPPSQDPGNKGFVQISHLSAMFGLFEVCAEIIDLYPAEASFGFEAAWLEYCRYFNGTENEQIARFGVKFGKLQLRQGHSRLTAYAASKLNDKVLAKRAWEQFFLEDGYGIVDGYNRDTLWMTEMVETHEAIGPVREATWISTNITALYGIAAIQNLALMTEATQNEPQYQ